ncbi:hypothetical protein C5167_020098 [Papaver somniferum]|uniref:RWD domain-containing protein n=1 Tax=Papaver somniferum TaxID=3469 RepID=A0A4Y7IVY4_PAPSO|nr:hypothetical protein C5167_020098 [Papaver somniferum]
MAKIYTLILSAKEWLDETFRQVVVEEVVETTKDDVIIPHGDAVTVQTFVAWRERFEAELALERAKLMPESALTTTKEKKLTGREKVPHKLLMNDEEDMLKHYLDESDVSSHSQRRSE